MQAHHARFCVSHVRGPELQHRESLMKVSECEVYSVRLSGLYAGNYYAKKNMVIMIIRFIQALLTAQASNPFQIPRSKHNCVLNSRPPFSTYI